MHKIEMWELSFLVPEIVVAFLMNDAQEGTD